MRIISGKYKGRKLQTRVTDNIRPTSDNVREAMFNIINNYLEMDEIRVADLFAGTGALGAEALSRGAEHCVFVEKSRKTALGIQQLMKSLNIEKQAFDIANTDCLKYLSAADASKKFALILCDPPYALNVTNQIISIIENRGLLFEEGLFVAEHAIGEKIHLSGCWEILAEKHYGSTAVDFLIYTP